MDSRVRNACDLCRITYTYVAYLNRRLIQAQPESSEGERPLISFLHAEFIHRVESVRDDRAVVWYSWRGIHYVALCQGFFDVLEGPFCFVSDDDVSLLLSVHPG